MPVVIPTLAEIKTSVYDLLQIPTADQASYDSLLLRILNMAQRDAQKKHDFELCKGRGYLTIVPTTGSLLASAQAGFSSGAPYGDLVSIKSIKRVKVWSGSTWTPGKLLTQEEYDALVERADRNTVPIDHFTDNVVDPSYSHLTFSTRRVVTLEGTRLYVPNDSENVQVLLHGQLWMTPYADWTDTDFLVQNGGDWLMWYAALVLNHKTGTWLPRSEGELNPPERYRDEAWESLILWDTFIRDTQQDLLAS